MCVCVCVWYCWLETDSTAGFVCGGVCVCVCGAAGWKQIALLALFPAKRSYRMGSTVARQAS